MPPESNHLLMGGSHSEPRSAARVGIGLMDLRQVRAIVTDSKVLSSLEPAVVGRYLGETGWAERHERRTGVVWTRQMSDGVATAFVPKDQDFADYPIRMTEVLAVLAVVEDRSQLAVLSDLLEQGEVRCPEGP
jgi:hypothetical protein